MSLEIRILGQLELCLEGQSLSLPATHKAQSLLAFLATHRDRPHSRERLADLFWPDRPRDKALHSLSTALWHIRRILPPGDHILADAQTVQFNLESDYWLDVEAFEKAVIGDGQSGVRDSDVSPASSPLVAAVELHRGDFLEGFYDDWCLEERYRLESLFVALLEQLIDLYQERDELEAALDSARRLLRQDPLREDIHRRVMRLYARQGHRLAILQQYQRCQAALREQLGIKSSGETTALCLELAGEVPNELVAAGVIPSLPAQARFPFSMAPVPLVERATELTTMQAAWEEVHQGCGHLLLIEGEAGIGKTRLVEEFASRVRWRGGQIALGRCYEYERPQPYQAITDALHALLGQLPTAALDRLPGWVIAEVSRLAPEIGEIGSDLPLPVKQEDGLQQTRLLDALTRFLQTASGFSPLLFILDDLHWSPDSTLTFLQYLAPRLDDASILLIGTFRGEEASPDCALRMLLSRMQRQGLASCLRLRRLSLAAVAGLMQDVSGCGDEIIPLAQRLHRETKGNPFFLLETVKALYESGDLQLHSQRWQADWGQLAQRSSLAAPSGVEKLIQARIYRLTQETQEALALAAVAGQEFDFAVLEGAWGKGEEAALLAVEELLRRQLIVETQGPAGRDYAFDHSKVQEVVYTSIHHRRRQRFHHLVAQAMERVYRDQPGVIGELAHHFDVGGKLEKALDYHGLAAEQAKALAVWREAERHHSRMLELLDRLDPDCAQPAYLAQRGQVLADRAHLCFLQGRLGERDADLAALITLAETSNDAGLRLQALTHQASYLNLDGQYAAAIAAAENGLDLAERLDDISTRCHLLAQIGFAHYFRGEHHAAMKPLQTALAFEPDDPAVLGEILSVLSYAYYLIADYQRSLDYRQQALAVRSESGELVRGTWDLTDMGILYTRLRRLPEAERYLADALALARKIGSQPAEAYALNNLGNLNALRGDYPTALECYADSLALQRTTGSRRGEASALCNSGTVRLMLGDYRTAELLLRQALAIQEEIGYESGLSETLACLALILGNQERIEEALSAATRSLAVAQRISDRYCQVMVLNVLARLRLVEKAPAKTVAVAEDAVALAQEVNFVSHVIVALALQGLGHLALGEIQVAIRLTTRAVDMLRGQGHIDGPEEEIYLAHYQALLALGRHKAAIETLHQAQSEMMRKAERLEDERLRRCFLEAVPINRAIMAASQAPIF